MIIIIIKSSNENNNSYKEYSITNSDRFIYNNKK